MLKKGPLSHVGQRETFFIITTLLCRLGSPIYVDIGILDISILNVKLDVISEWIADLCGFSIGI